MKMVDLGEIMEKEYQKHNCKYKTLITTPDGIIKHWEKPSKYACIKHHTNYTQNNTCPYLRIKNQKQYCMQK